MKYTFIHFVDINIFLYHIPLCYCTVYKLYIHTSILYTKVLDDQHHYSVSICSTNLLNCEDLLHLAG